MTISRRPKTIRRTRSSNDAKTEAWWYENRGSIDVIIRDADRKQSMTARIPRAQLARWLERTK